MDFDVLDNAENIRRKYGFEELQCLKSTSRITCIIMELNSELNPRIMMDLNRGLRFTAKGWLPV